MKLLIIALLSIATIASTVTPAVAGYEPPAGIGGPKRTGGSGGR